MCVSGPQYRQEGFAGVAGADYMSNMDLPPSSSEDESGEESENTDVQSNEHTRSQQQTSSSDQHVSRSSSSRKNRLESSHTADEQYSQSNLVEAVSDTEEDKEASDEDVASMSTLQQAHAQQTMVREEAGHAAKADAESVENITDGLQQCHAS